MEVGRGMGHLVQHMWAHSGLAEGERVWVAAAGVSGNEMAGRMVLGKAQLD